MPTDNLDLAALVGSRICHDLASPIGAAMTGLEFLSDIPGSASSEEMTLLRDSLAGARAALEMLRLAFGRAGEAERLDAGRLRERIEAHVATRPRLRLDWALSGTIPRGEAQRIALGLMCAAQALPRGGTLGVAPFPSDGVGITARGALAAEPALWEGLAGRAPLPAADPRRIEFHLLAGLSAAGAARICVMQGEETLTLGLLPVACD